MLFDRAAAVGGQEALEIVDALQEHFAHVRIRNALSYGGGVHDLLRGVMVRAGSARSADVTQRSVVAGTRGKRAICRRNGTQQVGVYLECCLIAPLR